MESIKKIFLTLIFKLIFTVVWLVSMIPFHTGQLIGRTLGRAFSLIPMGRTKISLDNLCHAFGDNMTEDELKELNRQVVMHFGQMLFEVPHILRLSLSNLDRYLTWENEERFFAAIEKEKGVFILGGHFGNWELLSAAINIYLTPNMAVIAREIDFVPLDRVINTLRSNFGVEVINKQRGIRKIMKALKDKKSVGILLDQNVDRYEGVFVPFLGRQACVNKGLALMALKTGTPVVPVFSVRQPDGRYRIFVEKEVELIRTGDKTRDVEENTALFTGIIEKYIRQYPDQWFWFHRRWKTMFYCPLPKDFYSKT